MIYGSVCSGIEAASVAWQPLGWEPAWFAEIEPFCCDLLAHYHPDVPNLGDMRNINGSVRRIDLLVGGTPCQSFSVAGKRLGLDDPRGNLTLEYLRIARDLRPSWLVWENVPGILSHDGGRTFGIFLGLLGQLGYGFAYRVLDAQFFGVPQRRRRVFVVGHLGDWRRAAAVLFERTSLRGDTAPRRKTGKGVASSLRTRSPGSGGQGTDFEQVVANCLHAHTGISQPDFANYIAPTIPSRSTAGGGLGTDFDLDGGLIAGTIDADYASKWGLDNQHVDAGCPNFVTHSLRGEGHDASEDGTGRGTPIVAFSCKDHGADSGAIAPTLRSMGHDGSHANAGGQVAVAFDTTQITSAANRSNPKPGDPCHPLAAGAHAPAIASSMAVRRLTPRECERLMGVPDDYTLIPRGKNGKPAADGPRYKALGNSMAVPVMSWIGERIQMVEEIP